MLGRRALKGCGRTHYIIREHAMTTDAQTRVLFIEDERELQRAYGRYFGSRYDVAVAGTGTEVVARLDGFYPNVLVLDMHLPYTDGIEVMRRLRDLCPDPDHHCLPDRGTHGRHPWVEASRVFAQTI